VQQLDASDCDGRISEALEAEHHRNALLHARWSCSYKIIQVLRRAATSRGEEFEEADAGALAGGGERWHELGSREQRGGFRSAPESL
jgi:hypothetical protein